VGIASSRDFSVVPVACRDAICDKNARALVTGTVSGAGCR
jgi:hypothetical protein